MRLLLIDTSGPVCAAAIYDAATDALLSSISETIGKGHAERLPGMVEQVATDAGLELKSLDRIAVTVGPGSFTGIRVGVALARGLALSLKIPAVGVTTLQVVAEPTLEISPPAPVLALIDARREELYAQIFSPDGQALTDPAAYTYEQARSMTERFSAIAVGSGSRVLAGEPSPQLDEMPLISIGRIGTRLETDVKAVPLYIRGADAKPQTGYGVARAASQ